MTLKRNEFCNNLAEVMEKAEALKRALKALPDQTQLNMAKNLSKRGWVRENPAVNELFIVALNIHDAAIRELCDEVGRQVAAEMTKKGD